jgi:hypothetical protein
MTKQFILAEIKRTARDGFALGRDSFTKETGIKERDWSGRYWARWSDAVKEAGLEPRMFQGARDEVVLFEMLLVLTRKLGHFPTIPEMDMERFGNPSFPSSRSITRRFDRKTLFENLLTYISNDTDWVDLEDTIRLAMPKSLVENKEETNAASDHGHVYLIRSDKVFKIGCSRALYNRTATVVRQSPFGGELIHSISTDDPEGIEQYWHKRFEASRIVGINKSSGEWFQLSAADISAFKRRKFM